MPELKVNMEFDNNKVCSKCKQSKPLSDFYKQNTSKDGRASRCRDCTIIYNQENRNKILVTRRRSNEKHKDIRHRRTNAYNHGMTLEEYDNFFVVRNYQCEVCGMTQEESYKLFGIALCIDHCHETGENKGLLCNLCNPASGMLKDNPDLAFKLWRYLERTRRKEG